MKYYIYRVCSLVLGITIIALTAYSLISARLDIMTIPCKWRFICDHIVPLPTTVATLFISLRKKMLQINIEKIKRAAISATLLISILNIWMNLNGSIKLDDVARISTVIFYFVLLNYKNKLYWLRIICIIMGTFLIVFKLWLGQSLRNPLIERYPIATITGAVGIALIILCLSVDAFLFASQRNTQKNETF